MTIEDRISDQVQRKLGIHLGPQKGYLLEARLQTLLQNEGYPDLEEFHGALVSGDRRAEEALARHLTTNHTYFFREEIHFTLVARHLSARRIQAPRLWSAAGSTGEEAYSLAMTLAETGVQDHLILVSDVNRRVVTQAKEGIYDPVKLERVPADLVRRHFTRLADGRFQASAALRSRMRFRCLNLVEPMEVDEPMDVIFCRNLMIYFHPETIRTVLDRLVAALKPGGWLILGQTEGLHTPGGTRRVGPSVYQKV